MVSKKIITIIFLAILPLARCAKEEGEPIKSKANFSVYDTFFQESSNLYSDVFMQNGSKNVATKAFSQNKNEEASSQTTIGGDPVSPSSSGSGTVAIINILWAIDNSYSMSSIQASLAENFNSFIENFLDQNSDSIDLDMAIITTDSRVNRVTGDELSSAAAKKNKVDFKNKFKEKIKVGNDGSSNERGIHFSREFIKHDSRKKTPWLRPDAYLIVIYVSDENDNSRYTVARDVKVMKSFMPNPDKLKLFSIVSLTNDPDNEHDSVGGRYMEASRLTGGSVYDIKKPFDVIFDDIGHTIISLLKFFELSRNNVYPDSIKVYVNDIRISNDHWEYRDQAIHFKQGHLPEEGAEIKVVYRNNVSLLTHFSLQHKLNPKALDTVKVTVNEDAVSREGWEYRKTTNSIHFKEGFVPEEGAKIKIVYTNL